MVAADKMTVTSALTEVRDALLVIQGVESVVQAAQTGRYLAKTNPNTVEFTGLFKETTNFLAVKDDITCSGVSGLIYELDDLSACYSQEEDPLYVIVSGGQVSMYSEDPGSDRPVPLDKEPCE